MDTDWSQFGVDEATGFLSLRPPLARLPSYFDGWEKIVDVLPALIRSGAIRDKINELPLLKVTEETLKSEREWWRAYVVLTFLGQSYIWAKNEEGLPPCLPANIAVPWCRVSEHIDMPPVVTYASTALNNWCFKEPARGFVCDNLRCTVTFTGTRDEEMFYIIPLLIEEAAGPAIRSMSLVYQSIDNGDYGDIEKHFRCMSNSLINMTAALNMMYEGCDPFVFFTQIRQFQAGTLGLDAFPEGLVYEGVDNGRPKKYSGASAAQTAALPVFDVFLGVTHRGEVQSFLLLQRKHMPKLHRELLDKMSQLPSVRDHLIRLGDLSLINAFNDVVDQLAKFRSQHIILVTRYIIIPKAKLSNSLNKSLDAKGTGGSHFMNFLKSSRNETLNCKINKE
jgi:indoleamine 2,3-dioxygenase